MSKVFAEEEIAALLREPKSLEGYPHKKIELRRKRGHKEETSTCVAHGTGFG